VTNLTLAANSNLTLYSAMAVYTIAMLAFATDLARTQPRDTALLVQLPPLAQAHQAEPSNASSATDRKRARGIAMALSWLGTGLLLTAVLLRALSVMRVPWGNMFEFATTGSLAVALAFLVINLRRDLRWAGLFVIGPVLLTLGLAITVYYTAASQLLPSLRSFWLVIHVSVAIVAVALFTIGFSVTIVYLVRA